MLHQPLHIMGMYDYSLLGVSVPHIIFSPAVIYAVRRWALPRRLKGIPYNSSAATSIFGDLSSMVSDPDGLTEWHTKQLGGLQSPICQVLIGPGFSQKPMILVADVGGARESILGQTGYDRSSYLINRFPLFGDFHLNLSPALLLHGYVPK